MSGQQNDFYTQLGVPRDATPEEIRRAYREAARRLHPDTNTEPGATELFIDIQHAYEILNDPDRRANYDAALPPQLFAPVLLNTYYSRSALPYSNEPQLIYTLLEINPQTQPSDHVSPPLNVCIVMDTSTSMQGALMDTLKSTAIDLTRQLRPQDILSLVAFSDRAEVLVGAGSRQDQKLLETNIRMLQPRGGTEIYRGLEAGFNEVRRGRDSKHVNHILLITDGHTYGDEAKCGTLAEQAASLGIGISSLGIGSKWNDPFLDRLASLTGGSCVFVAKSKDVRHYIQEKFSGMGKSFAENVTYHLNPGEKVQLKSAFRLQPDPGPLELNPPLRFGILPNDTNLNILLEFVVESVPVNVGPFKLSNGRIEMDVPSRNPGHYSIRLELNRPTSLGGEEDLPPQAILQAMSRISLYRLQERARVCVSEGNIQDATHHLQQMATHLLAQGQNELARTVLSEAQHLQKNLAFSEDGEKRIKYGTRGLLLPAVSGGR